MINNFKAIEEQCMALERRNQSLEEELAELSPYIEMWNQFKSHIKEQQDNYFKSQRPYFLYQKLLVTMQKMEDTELKEAK